MSILENNAKFNNLEREIFKKCCQKGCELLSRMLEEWDVQLMLERDRTGYRHKGKRKTVIKTIMGEVSYERAVYERKNEDGLKSFVYLLDEALGLDRTGFISGMLAERIAVASCDMSYRNAAKSVGEMTGQTVSHTGAWNVVQAIGERIDDKEQQEADLASQNCGSGKREAKLLFEEQDGIWLKMQGKDRKKLGVSYEMKLAIAYDGAKKTGKNRFELTNKIACANFEGIDSFCRRKEGVIAANYNVDEVEMRVLNGDGANWIKRSITDETVHYQLDTFHRNKAILQYVSNKEMRKNIFKLLYSKQIDDLLIYIEALSNSVEDEKEKENLLTLLTYFTNNKTGLISYQCRNLNLPEPKNGLIYRGCGAMESNVFTLIGNRMKGRRACWSTRGGNNLARLLCLKTTKKLSEALHSLSNICLSEKYSEEIVSYLSAAKVKKSVGKGYNGFAKSTIPSSVKWMKELFAAKPLSEIKM